MDNYITQEEIWKGVKGWESFYQVSNLGSVRSLDRTYIRKDGFSVNKKGRVMKTPLNSDGYPIIHLKADGRRRTTRVHRIVAESLIPNPNNFSEVNHKDEDKTNNNIDNLEWCTHYYNANYGTMLTRMYEHPNQIASLERSKKPIVGVEIGTGKEIRFESVAEADRNGFPRRNVQAAIKGYDKTCRGYIWFFEKDFNEAVKDKSLKALNKKVVKKDHQDNILNEYPDTKKAGKSVGRDPSNISRACTLGRTCAGYKWEYRLG